MKMVESHKWSFRLLLLGLIVVLLAGCGIDPARGRRPSPDWSRARYIGQFVNGALSLASNADSSQVHVIWPFQAGGSFGIHYLQLDSNGEVVIERDLPLPPSRHRSPRLFSAGSDRYHLVWASRPGGAAHWTIWHVLMDSQGALVNEPSPITVSDVPVGSYSAAPDASGNAVIVWDGGDEGGIYGRVVHADGEFDPTPLTISADGESPAIQVDSLGAWHLAWRNGNDVIYGSRASGKDSFEQPTTIATTSAGTGIALVGPEIGLSRGWTYVFWDLRLQSGLEAGTARVEYVAFPAGAPLSMNPSSVGLYKTESVPYQAYVGAFPLTQIVAPASRLYTTDFVYGPNPLTGQRDAMAVALTAYQEFRQEGYSQSALALFEDGDYVGYQPAGKTESLSQGQVLAADSANNLHMVWREGAAGNRVYYATTAPKARAALNRLDEQDIMHATLRGSMEGLSGLAMLPFALIWVLPGAMFVVIIEMVWSQEKQTKDIARALLAVSIILYLATKVFLFPTILSYVPFSAWLDIPAGLGKTFRILVPFLILGIASLVAWRVRENRSESNLVFYFALSVTDALLTLLVYGVNFWSTV